MDRNSIYYKQVALLIQTLPYVSEENCFALKGGTAINLFVRNFPRLSVDIDLAYLPLESREDALKNVQKALLRITQRLNNIHGLTATLQDNKPDELRIIVSSKQAQIKIEVSPVARGALLEANELDIVGTVEDEFGFASIQVVSLADLYGGKLCAALDRQHPRDLFDIKILLEEDGIDRSIFNGFITYALSHNRPISEIMEPNWKDISDVFDNEFQGMTKDPISLQELTNTPERMLNALKAHFTQNDYDFLISFKHGEPNWSIAPHQHIQDLPAVKWKLINIRKMSQKKHAESIVKLESTLTHWML